MCCVCVFVFVIYIVLSTVCFSVLTNLVNRKAQHPKSPLQHNNRFNFILLCCINNFNNLKKCYTTYRFRSFIKNLKLWNCSPTNLCLKCGVDQTNKHVLSNCNSPDALARYTDRHNRILELIARWIVPLLKSNQSLYCDLRVSGARSICDLFNSLRPDLAIVSPTKIVVGELTVCHETNLQQS